MTKIKYDKKDKRLYMKFALICSILAVLDCCLLNSEDILRHFPTEVEAVCICAFGGLCLLSVGLWIGYMDVILYLKRLQGFGYEIPEDKRKFNKNLEKLFRKENIVKKGLIKNYEGIALTGLTGTIVLSLFIYDILFWYRYSLLGKDILFFEGILLFGTLIWLLLAISYGRQLSNQKYKYDVEIDYSRKNRKNLIEGVLEIILLLALTLPSIQAINSAVQYMIKAREGR